MHTGFWSGSSPRSAKFPFQDPVGTVLDVVVTHAREQKIVYNRPRRVRQSPRDVPGKVEKCQKSNESRTRHCLSQTVTGSTFIWTPPEGPIRSPWGTAGETLRGKSLAALSARWYSRRPPHGCEDFSSFRPPSYMTGSPGTARDHIGFHLPHGCHKLRAAFRLTFFALSSLQLPFGTGRLIGFLLRCADVLLISIRVVWFKCIVALKVTHDLNHGDIATRVATHSMDSSKERQNVRTG